MPGGRRARDLELLDALEGLPRVSVHQPVWRVVRSDRDPLLCRAVGGRWDLGRFDVLYTSFAADGAVAEMYFHLSRQPVFPSTVQFTLHEIEVTTRSTLKLADLGELERLGVEPDRYSGLLYARCQEIGDAAAFLGCDGIIAPSARWDCLNLAAFCDGLSPDDLVLGDSSPIDWASWLKSHGRVPR